VNAAHRVFAALAVVFAAAAAPGGEDGKAVMTAKADLVWKDMGIPGVMAAVVSGDMAKGPSRFFIKYPAGLVTPPHHHTSDHYVTVVSGTLVLTAGGRETKLEPGSYFALTGKATHVARVPGSEECVMFIQADGPWDVVPEKEK
jgi:quercetin dioxygenase-like cupin family protein